MSRVQDQVHTVPICTLFLVGVNVAAHGLIFISSTNIGNFANSAYQVIYLHQYYRIVTSAFTHGGILHILMNMMSLLQLGGELERKFGTIVFLLLSLWSVLLCGSLYVSINWSLSVLINAPGELYSSAVGYSGVLFSYALISSYHTTAPMQSVFGLFNVPSKIYPWILLGIMQIILPNISLIGHLSGILVGLFAVYGVFDTLLIPSKEFCKGLDDRNCCFGITRRSNYCQTTDNSITTSSCTGGGGTCGENACRLVSSIWFGIAYVFWIVWSVFATLLHILGCPASVTSLSCCGDMAKKFQSLFSSIRLTSTRRGGDYDEVSGGSTGDTMNLRSMNVNGVSRVANSGRVNSGARYERLETADNDIDVEQGNSEKASSDKNTAAAVEGSKSKKAGAAPVLTL